MELNEELRNALSDPGKYPASEVGIGQPSVVCSPVAGLPQIRTA
jgi:hypothetical protein